MKTEKKSSENKITKTQESSIPFLVDKQIGTDVEKKFNNSKKVNKMKTTGKSPAASAVTAKNRIPGKPQPQSLKRAAAEKAKLTVVKDDPGTAGKKKDTPLTDSTKSLQYTLRIVDDLSRKVKQRAVIMETLDSIEEFSFTQESKEGEYNGCVVRFSDDGGNKWEIRNLELIVHLAKEAKAKCREKLDEIEKSIFLPKSAA